MSQSQAVNLSYQQSDLLRIYAIYRVGIAAVLLAIFIAGTGRGVVGTNAPELYFYTALSYLIANIGLQALVARLNYSVSGRPVSAMLALDVCAFLLFIHASGLSSGLGYLLIITVAMGTTLLDKRMGAFYAAVASLAVIVLQVYAFNRGDAQTSEIVSAGGLGILLFCTVLGLQYLAIRMRTATWRAEQQARQADHLQRLAQQIIERMDTGVLVVDGQGEVELVNRSALQLLGDDMQPGGRFHARIQDKVREWRTNRTEAEISLDAGDRGQLKLEFADMEGATANTLVFIEDNRKLHQRAQQLKLGSLGHLTGSIAHEIRNPLGAISHAAQLLSEEQGLNRDCLRLTEIISQQSHRVNQIIENVMLLSRRRARSAQRLDTRTWLEQFVADFRAGADEDCRITTYIPDEPVIARFDPHQLSQVLTNLCQNALRHSASDTGVAAVEINVRNHPQLGHAVIDVIDFGAGVPQEHRDKIFEPFFTTGQSSSGLGLYIARELCESNQASLVYGKNRQGHSCFRIELAHPAKVF
ncbi:sensor histidine kinase [Biformimicrobium ophioploci]|nr:HAMP domain-containing sensor histidine kinase [Microbulbifer sp. NKW57]